MAKGEVALRGNWPRFPRESNGGERIPLLLSLQQENFSQTTVTSRTSGILWWGEATFRKASEMHPYHSFSSRKGKKVIERKSGPCPIILLLLYNEFHIAFFIGLERSHSGVAEEADGTERLRNRSPVKKSGNETTTKKEEDREEEKGTEEGGHEWEHCTKNRPDEPRRFWKNEGGLSQD